MLSPSDPPVLAAGFTLGCWLIHALRQHARALTTALVIALWGVSLLLFLVLADRAMDERYPLAVAQAFGTTSDHVYGFE